MRLNNPPLVLDNTVIGNFGLINQFGIILSLYKGQLIVPIPVVVEAFGKHDLKVCLEKAITNKEIEEFSFSTLQTPGEMAIYAKLRKRFDEGESSVLAVAEYYQCAVASDDMKAVRKYCNQKNIELIGTLGILYDAFNTRLITDHQAHGFLTDMIANGYKCPVTSFNQICDWFEHGIGQRLY